MKLRIILTGKVSGPLLSWDCPYIIGNLHFKQ